MQERQGVTSSSGKSHQIHFFWSVLTSGGKGEKKQNISTFTNSFSFSVIHHTDQHFGLFFFFFTHFDQTITSKTEFFDCGYLRSYTCRILLKCATDRHISTTTNADKGAIRPEQSTTLGFARSPLASLSLWPEIMWSDYAHGSSDVFPEEFDSDGGREEGWEEGGQQVTTGTAKSLAWFYHFRCQYSVN